MGRAVAIAGFIIALSAKAMAQDTSPIHVFGGYSYFRLNGGANLHGWNASVAGNINGWFELVADFSGHYGSLSRGVLLSSDDFPFISGRPGERANLHLILGGPQFSSRNNERIEPFGHVLFGAAHLRANATARLGDLILEVPFANTSFAMAAGGGLDIKLNESFALRLVQADYVLTSFGRRPQGNLRLSVGIVIR